jgi:glycosyltransferase involved in cell wall biosynthesis
MSRDPRFSVVVPAHDAESTIGDAIRSVLAQTCDDFELIVVDDGSSDETASIVRDFAAADARIRLVSQPNKGPAAARNTAIELARGELVSMLDGDDLWLPRYLERMGEVLDRERSAAFAYTDAWVLGSDGAHVRTTTAMAHWRPPSRPPREPHRFLALLLERSNFIYTSVTVRREALVKCAGFDERLWHGEDFELWVRLLEARQAAVFAGEVLAIHRERPGSLTSDPRRLYEGICKVYRLILDEHELSGELRAVASSRATWWERQVELLDRPSGAERLRRLARRLKGRLLARRQRLRVLPADVEQTLTACLPPRD